MDNLPPHLLRRWLRPAEASEFLTLTTGVNHSTATLATWRVRPPTGGGPAFRKVGRCVVYDRSELVRFANARLGSPVHSTSEVQA